MFEAGAASPCFGVECDAVWDVGGSDTPLMGGSILETAVVMRFSSVAVNLAVCLEGLDIVQD